jgi:hypothetical protein
MTFRCRTLLPALLSGLCTIVQVGSAQNTDSTYGRRALERFLERTRADARLPDSLRSLTVERLDSLSVTYFGNLDDSSMALYLRTTVAMLRQLPEPLCAAAGGLSGEHDLTLVRMLTGVDSVTADSLLRVHELALLAATRGASPRVGTPEELHSVMGRLITGLPPEQQQRFMFVARNPPPSQADACWASQTLFGELAKLPPSELGPVMRRMSTPPAPRH